MNGRFTINTQYNSIDEHISRNKITSNLLQLWTSILKLVLSWTTKNHTFKRTEIFSELKSPDNMHIYTLSSKYVQNSMKFRQEVKMGLCWRKTELTDRRIKIPPPFELVACGIKYEIEFAHIHYHWLLRQLMFVHVRLSVSAFLCRKRK